MKRHWSGFYLSIAVQSAMPIDLNEVRLRVLRGAVDGLRRWAALQSAAARSAPAGAIQSTEWARVFGRVDHMLGHASEPAFTGLDTYHAYRRLLGRLAGVAHECRRNIGVSSGLESHAWRLAAQELTRMVQDANRAPRWLRERAVDA